MGAASASGSASGSNSGSSELLGNLPFLGSDASMQMHGQHRPYQILSIGQQQQQQQMMMQPQYHQQYQSQPQQYSRPLSYDSSGLGIAHVATTESSTSISTTYQYRSTPYGKKRKASKPGRFDCKVPGCGKKYNSSGGIRYHLRHCKHEGMEQTDESLEQLREVMEKEKAAQERLDKLREEGTLVSPAMIMEQFGQMQRQAESMQARIPKDLPDISLEFPALYNLPPNLQLHQQHLAAPGTAIAQAPMLQPPPYSPTRRSPPRLSHPASPMQSPIPSTVSSPDKNASVASVSSSPMGDFSPSSASNLTVPEFTEAHARLLAMHEAQLMREHERLQASMLLFPSGHTSTAVATGAYGGDRKSVV